MEEDYSLLFFCARRAATDKYDVHSFFTANEVDISVCVRKMPVSVLLSPRRKSKSSLVFTVSYVQTSTLNFREKSSIPNPKVASPIELS